MGKAEPVLKILIQEGKKSKQGRQNKILSNGCWLFCVKKAFLIAFIILLISLSTSAYFRNIVGQKSLINDFANLALIC